jgi:hypothetical protein
MGGRVYDPSLGRFLSVDPFIQSETSTQSQNAYTYVMNNPLSGTDPSGYTCHGPGCGGWQDYQHSKQIHGMQQPQYRETRSGADMIADFLAWQSFNEAERIKEHQRTLFYALGHTSFKVRYAEPYTDEHGVYHSGIREVILIAASLRLLYGEEEMRARRQAWAWMRDREAQHRWSVGRYRQFQGDLIVHTVKPLAEWGEAIATLPVGGIGATGRVASMLPVGAARFSVAARGIGATGRVGEAALKALGGESQVAFRTSLGRRAVDQLVRGVAHESKVGYASLTKSVARQIAKDVELIGSREIQGATWHFFRSSVTGRIGPSAPLRQALEEAGMRIVIH